MRNAVSNMPGAVSLRARTLHTLGRQQLWHLVKSSTHALPPGSTLASGVHGNQERYAVGHKRCATLPLLTARVVFQLD
jgi:hypothetical protein